MLRFRKFTAVLKIQTPLRAQKIRDDLNSCSSSASYFLLSASVGGSAQNVRRWISEKTSHYVRQVINLNRMPAYCINLTTTKSIPASIHNNLRVLKSVPLSSGTSQITGELHLGSG